MSSTAKHTPVNLDQNTPTSTGGGVSRKNTLTKMAKLFGSNLKTSSQQDIRSAPDNSSPNSFISLTNLHNNGSASKQKKTNQRVARESSVSPPPESSLNIYHNSSSVSLSSNLHTNTKPLISPESSASSSITSSVSASSLSSNSPTSATTSKVRNSNDNNSSFTSTASSTPCIGRFIVHEDGTHEHHLKNTKRQEKLSSMIKNMVGAQKIRGQAKSAVPDIMMDNKLNQSQASIVPQGTHPAQPSNMDPPTLFAGLMRQMAIQRDLGNDNVPISGASNEKRWFKGRQTHNGSGTDEGISVNPNFKKQDSLCFAEKYGRCQEVLGKGAFGVVRICHKKNQPPVSGSKTETLFAVKEFKRRATETPEKYSKRLTSEFCISSSLRHTNIIMTLDLFQDVKGDYCEVMEYCAGGDLFTLIIAAGKLEYLEADCFFKQLIRGVVYMHDMGVCHRDLKPENLLLKSDGTLKIIDFGNSECFKMAWEKDVHLSAGVCGSSPYIAPEEYSQEEFDPRPVDIWACGVIYMAMRTGRQLWRVAQKEDEFYSKYLKGRKEKGGYEPVENLKRARCRNVIYSMLDPVPHRRINAKQILNSEWGREIKCCNDGHALK